MRGSRSSDLVASFSRGSPCGRRRKFCAKRRLSTFAPIGPSRARLSGWASLHCRAMSASVRLLSWAPWPRLLHNLGELFRATGRFIWPFYYFLFFAGMLIVSRRYSQQTLLVLLSGIVTVQAIDTTAGWRGENAYLHQPKTPPEPRFRSRFWDEAAMRYRAIRLAPHSNNAPLFGDVARVAVEHKMWTDAVYLARLSVAAGAASSARVEHRIATGKWPTDTLFVLDEATARRIAASNDPRQNFLARVDGVAVLAPAWTGCSDCGAEALRFN